MPAAEDEQFEFIAELPPRKRREDSGALMAVFAAACKERPRMWGRWPLVVPTAYVTLIRQGKLSPFQACDFEAVHRNGDLYVRYISSDGGR